MGAIQFAKSRYNPKEKHYLKGGRWFQQVFSKKLYPVDSKHLRLLNILVQTHTVKETYSDRCVCPLVEYQDRCKLEFEFLIHNN